ncbi:MAG: helix-turn-helix domain-containing protein [Candidatus Mariimomonas ferrooxydans]
MKQIGDIKLYSVIDLHNALGVNERTIRDWFNKGRLKGRKIGNEWFITEENLKKFLNGDGEAKIQGSLF